MASGENEQPHGARMHPRDMHEDDRKEVMSALARKRWEKRDRMRTAANEDASHDASADASEPDGGASQKGVATSGGGSSVDDAVICELERKALQGDVSAARELRSWREARFVQERGDLSSLDRDTRRRLLDRLLKELADEAG